MPHRFLKTAPLFAALVASCAAPLTAAAPTSATETAALSSPAPIETPPACPPASSSPELPDTNALPGDPSGLTDFLDRGGDIPRLLEHLQAAGLVPLFPGSQAFAAGDFDGDGRPDIALSLQEPNSESGPWPPGALLVWLCRPGGYVLAYQSQPMADHGAPVLLAGRELTGDDGIELVAGRPLCGAHTCFLTLIALTWNGQQLVDAFSGTSEDLPSPTVMASTSATGVGTISITAGGAQSVGAGPPRPRTRTWTWGPQTHTFIAGADVLSAPVFRIHVVHDADAAFEAGDMGAAEALYDRALSDGALQEWEAGPATPASLKAYVHYRLVLLALARGGHAAAQETFNAMVEATVAVPEAAPYLSMAQLLLQATDPVSLPAACGTVRGYAAENPSQVLDPLYYGYDNRIYTADDLCPFE